MANPSSPAPLLEVKSISKRFGAIQALRDMSFDLQHGEVHVLFGENGAGKSTLINIICGALRPDQGSLHLNCSELRLRDVQHARSHGIAAMFQEFSIAPHLSVEENMFLGAEPGRGIWLNRGVRRKKARAALQRFGFDLLPDAIVGTLSRAQQQMVEMIKALLVEPKILILDEPTASLSERETEALFNLVRELRSKGVGIIYITHRIKEIETIGDRVTIMRDGQLIKTVNISDVGNKELVELMTGRSFDTFYPAIKFRPQETLLRVEEVTTADGLVKDVSISLRAGEIVGLAGLVGCGKSEIGRTAFGIKPIGSGRIVTSAGVVDTPRPRLMLERGVTYITSDRRGEGLMLSRSTGENITLPSLGLKELSRRGWLNRPAERGFAQRLGERMRVRPLELAKDVSAYSGGNQQKIVIAKALGRSASVFIFDEPTVGIDASARVEVYSFMKDLVEAGAAILMISSDLPEVLNMSHRLYVIRDGRVVDHIEQGDIGEARVLHGFFGTRAA